jgi:TPR repeat protein
MKRIKKNDPAAMREMGKKCDKEGDYETAFKYYTKAAVLGDADAQYSLSILYRDGEGVEKDERKEVYHLEEAAIGGHPAARHNLGIEEYHNGRFERAAKHFIIAAKLEMNDSLKGLKKLYANGHVRKEEYAAALRAYQAAVEATKSLQRDVADAYYKAMDKAQRNQRILMILSERKKKQFEIC